MLFQVSTQNSKVDFPTIITLFFLFPQSTGPFSFFHSFRLEPTHSPIHLSKMTSLLNVFDVQFDSRPAIEFVRNHNEIPAIAIAVYLCVVFLVPKYMANRQPMALRPLFKIWNLGLSTFSIIGAVYTVPAAFHFLSERGLRWTVCTDPLDDYFYDGPVGFWFYAFALSKIPELGDTLFLVVQKKDVIFLHWYHHITVLAYCWHAYQVRVGGGIFFASMNYFVHSIMYTYYFLMCFPVARKFIRKIAIFITSIQLLQMCVGVAVTFITAYYYQKTKTSGQSCHVDVFNLELAFGMYTSYFILFGALFRKLYGPKPKNAAPKTKSA